MIEIKERYKKRKSRFENEKKTCEKKLLMMSFSRLIFFLAIPGFYILFQELNLTIKVVVTICIATCFGISVRRYFVLKDKIAIKITVVKD